MSGTGEGGEKEKKFKPGLVRLNRASLSPSTPNANLKLGATTLNKSSVSLLSPLNRSSGVQSFKPKRDLTLGGGGPASIPSIKTISSVKPLERKKFVPNLNVTRQVKKEKNVESSGAATAGKLRKEKKFERRDKKNRDRPSLIQTDSIFSEGNLKIYARYRFKFFYISLKYSGILAIFFLAHSFINRFFIVFNEC